MLQNWLILLPELVLLSFVPVAWLVNIYRENKTAKTFFTLSKIFLALALLFTVVFYNKSVWPGLWQNSRYSTMFKVLVYVVGLVWFYLSSKWFLNKSRSSFRFYLSGMLMLLLFGVLLSAQSLLVPLVLVPVLCGLTYWLILQHRDEDKVKPAARCYALTALVFGLGLAWGALTLRYLSGSFAFAAVQNFLAQPENHSLLAYSAAVAVVASLLFMMAAAPFHLWFVNAVSVAVLPVCGFLTLIPPFVYVACLITLMTGIFAPLLSDLNPLLQGFAAFSLFVGAVSANGQSNIRRLFAFSTIYNLGVMLFGILAFSAGAVVSSFVYTVIYVLAMIGVYTVFLAFKSKGDYLEDMADISGISAFKPYVSAAFLLFMISLIGVPPLLGFWGRLSLVNTLMLSGSWWQVLSLLVALVLMANAYLHVIRAIYFAPAHNSFDRTDKAIYICLFVNLLLVLISIINPAYLLHDTEAVLSGVLQ